MTKEKKSEYTLRITQANKAELIVILYEITIDYVEEAIAAASADNIGSVSFSTANAIRCIEEMQQNLHFEYDLAKSLNRLYTYMKSKLRAAYISGETDGLNEVLDKLKKLKESYEKIAPTDTSGPVMIHTQTVLSGMTYSKDKVLDELTNDTAGRGYRV